MGLFDEIDDDMAPPWTDDPRVSVLDTVAVVTFVDAQSAEVLGAVSAINEMWVQQPVKNVIETFCATDQSTPQFRLTMTGVEMTRATKPLLPLGVALRDTLETHGVEATGELVESLLSAFARQLVFRPARPTQPGLQRRTELPTISKPDLELEIGDLVRWRGEVWTVTKYRPKKGTVDLVRGYGKNQREATKVDVHELSRLER